MNVLLGGEIGDAIYAMPALRAIGNVNVFVADRPWYRPKWVERAQSLKELFLQQPYISSFNEHSGEHIDYDLTTYRDSGGKYGETITSKIARYARVSHSTDKWLDVVPSKATEGKVVISRGARWHGFYFPWKDVVKAIGSDAVFIGTKQEHLDFCKAFGSVEPLECKTMLEVAQAIAGCSLFIGNQSSPFACAEGLKKDSVLEVCLNACDCIYHRPNCTYCIDGELSFTLNGKEYSFPSFQPPRSINRQVTPKGGWHAEVNGVHIRSFDFKQCEMACRAEYVRQGITPPPLPEIQSSIEKNTVAFVPDLGIGSFNPSLTKKVMDAKAYASTSPPN